MRTRTSSDRGTQSLSGSFADLSHAVPTKRAAAAALVALALVPLLVLVTLSYGLSSEYGFVAGDLQPVDALVVLLLSGVALLLLLSARRQVGARRPSSVVLALAVVVIFAGSAAASATFGGAAHDRRTAAVASACSAGDLRLLAGLGGSVGRDEPHGDPDGRCVLTLFPGGDTPAVVADLTAALEGQGWRATGGTGDVPTLERGGQVLTVTTVSDDKATELVLTLD